MDVKNTTKTQIIPGVREHNDAAIQRAEELKTEKEAKRIVAVYDEDNARTAKLQKDSDAEYKERKADSQFRYLENNIEKLTAEDCLLGQENIEQYKKELFALVPDAPQGEVDTKTLKRVIKQTDYLAGLHKKLGERRETLLAAEKEKKSAAEAHREGLNKISPEERYANSPFSQR